MSTTDEGYAAHDLWDPELTERVVGWMRPMLKKYHRIEVRGLEHLEGDAGALVVSNHSGGMYALDAPVLAAEFYHEFGYERPVFTLSHDILFKTPAADILARTGFIPANHAVADAALRGGGVVIVFPGGTYDVYRPTRQSSIIDFNGRTGYVRAALNAGVPIVPVVSIGGQENQFILTRGAALAKALRLDKLARTDILPISFGIPFGFSVVLPPNLPLPTKVVTQVLPAVDPSADFGDEPDIKEIDQHIRSSMQDALDTLASERRFPIIG